MAYLDSGLFGNEFRFQSHGYHCYQPESRNGDLIFLEPVSKEKAQYVATLLSEKN